MIKEVLQSALTTTYFTTYDDYYAWWYRYTHNWHECNTFCIAYIVTDVLSFLQHLYINAHSLNGWAGGSIILLAYSYYTFWVTMFSALLMVGDPATMMAPYRLRLTFFSLSTVTVFLFLGNIGTVLMKYLLGKTPTDSFSEIINMYFLLIQVGAFVPSLFIFLFDGLAFSPYSIFNRDYGKWDDIVLPGQVVPGHKTARL